MHKLRVYLLSAMAMLLVACNSSDNTITNPPDGGTGGGGGGGGGGGPTAASISVSSDVATIPADGSVDATLTAFVRDSSNALISGVPVSFTATSGGVAGSPATTDATGTATATLVTAGDTSLRTITVTATAGSLQATVQVQVVASTGGTSLQMGSGSGVSFQPGVIAVANSMLSAGGSTGLSVSIVQSGGTLYTGSATITFNSPCLAAGTAEVRQNGVAVPSLTTTTGVANVTYVALGCNGPDIITASSTVNSQSLSASGTVSVAAATVGSIEFVSATPTNIALLGTGDANRPESSIVVFRVKDASGGAVSGASVAFSLNTTVGGIQHSPTTATSDGQGLVQTVVTAGTVATSVRVTAAVTSVTPQISTQSSQLTVTTGIPTDASFSLAVECFNIEGWDYDGQTTGVTARLGDRFQNPVPDGTAVTFNAEGGNILSSCTTATTASEGGVCKVTYRSSNPRPSDGRVSVLATAIGEESFVDTNSNGAFDNGESFSDLPEVFRDDDEDGIYDSGEIFFDFNNNQTRDLADGLFNGVLCNDTTGRCGGASTRSLGIGEQNLVILSGSTASISQSDGSWPALLSFPAGTASVLVWVRDLHENPMPAGTTVSAKVGTGGVTVEGATSYIVPCSAIAAGVQFPGITVFQFTVKGAAASSAVLSIEVKTPNNVLTTKNVTVEFM
jgi:hypothetical protein